MIKSVNSWNEKKKTVCKIKYEAFDQFISCQVIELGINFNPQVSINLPFFYRNTFLFIFSNQFIMIGVIYT